jgi:hypothetical protein
VADFGFWLSLEAIVIHLTRMKTDVSLLQAALVGYQSQIAEMEKAMAEIRQRIGSSPVSESTNGTSAKRRLSAAARKRISAAQKKRWAEYNKQKGQ